MHSKALDVESYLLELTPERREAIGTVRALILSHLPEGYVETMNWGMISYEVPLQIFPETYNKQPLMYAALASQKNYMAVYLSAIYQDANRQAEFEAAYRATGKKLNMGKSCVRFKTLADLPLELVGQCIASVPLAAFLEGYQLQRAASRRRKSE